MNPRRAAQGTSLSPDGRFLFGVNYWPAAKAMYWWKAFDRDEVRRDFERIRSLGMDTVRFFLLWEDFQPAPDSIDPAAIERFAAVLDAGQEHGLGLIPTLFTGHMSGANWLPPWALGDGHGDIPSDVIVSAGRVFRGPIRDIFGDAGMVDAAERLAAGVAAAAAGHRALLAWDLGNEPSQLFTVRSRPALLAWIDRMRAALRAGAPAPVMIGTHQADVWRETGYRVDEIAPHVDVACMHAYPDYRGGVDGRLDSIYPAFMNLLTERLSGGPVLMAETGLPVVSDDREKVIEGNVALVGETRASVYWREVVENLVRCGSLGVIAWCFSDYDPGLFHRAPFADKIHERHFGIYRADGTPKPHAAVIRESAAARPLVRPATPPRSAIFSSFS